MPEELVQVWMQVKDIHDRIGVFLEEPRTETELSQLMQRCLMEAFILGQNFELKETLKQFED